MLGLSLTFAALGLLILAMILLERISRSGTRRLIPDERDLEETSVVSTLARDTEDEEIVAAIAVALAHLRSLDMGRSGLGEALEAGPGPWGTGYFSYHRGAARPPARPGLSARRRAGRAKEFAEIFGDSLAFHQPIPWTVQPVWPGSEK